MRLLRARARLATARQHGPCTAHAGTDMPAAGIRRDGCLPDRPFTSTKEVVAMGADMLLRDRYLPAGISLVLPAAKAVASTLCRQASAADLRILLENDWISHPTLYDYDPTNTRIAEQSDELRETVAQSLQRLLDTFAASLHERDVARFRFDRPGPRPASTPTSPAATSMTAAPPTATTPGRSSMTATRFPTTGAPGSAPPACCTRPG
ncbi:hypothetical protein ACQP2X_39665 [Actinoplanes sp. CA-131856]